jgi:hypothetical protein
MRGSKDHQQLCHMKNKISQQRTGARSQRRSSYFKNRYRDAEPARIKHQKNGYSSGTCCRRKITISASLGFIFGVNLAFVVICH